MSNVSRSLLLVHCLLLTFVAGCDSNPTVTISASYIEKDSAGEIAIGSTGNMTSKNVGAHVSVGSSSDEMVTVTIAEIRDDKVVLDVSHSKLDEQQLEFRLGESKDVFLGDGSLGVRLKCSEAE